MLPPHPDERVPTRGGGRAVGVWLAVILALGTALRLIGLQFGRPLLVHADEWAIVVNAVDLAKRNSFEPTFFDRPDHFEIKLNYLLDTVYSWVRYGQPLDASFANHTFDYYVIGRGVSAAFGVVCILLAFLIARKFGNAAGLVAAALFAVFPPLVQFSHYATPETPQLAFMLFTILLCQYYLEKPGAGIAALIGASIGVGVTIKYPAIIGSVMVAVVVGVAAIKLRSWRTFLGHGVVAVLALIGTVAVVSPVLLAKLDQVWRMVGQQGQPSHLGADGLDWFGNAVFYFDSFLTASGGLLALAALGGAIWVIWRRPIDTLPLFAGVVYWLALSGVALHWSRWAVPMYTTGLLFAAIGVQVFFAWAWSRSPKDGRVALVTRRLFAVVLGVLVGLNQIVASVVVVSSLVVEDTRVEGLRFAESVGATKSNAIYEGYTPMLPGSPRLVFDNFRIRDGRLYLSNRAPQGAKFLILSGGMRSRYLAEARYVDEQYFYYLVDHQLPVIKSIEPVIKSFDQVESRPAAACEPLNIAQQAAAVARYAGDGKAGPQVVFYDLSGLERDGGG